MYTNLCNADAGKGGAQRWDGLSGELRQRSLSFLFQFSFRLRVTCSVSLGPAPHAAPHFPWVPAQGAADERVAVSRDPSPPSPAPDHRCLRSSSTSATEREASPRPRPRPPSGISSACWCAPTRTRSSCSCFRYRTSPSGRRPAEAPRAALRASTLLTLKRLCFLKRAGPRLIWGRGKCKSYVGLLQKFEKYVEL